MDWYKAREGRDFLPEEVRTALGPALMGACSVWTGITCMTSLITLIDGTNPAARCI